MELDKTNKNQFSADVGRIEKRKLKAQSENKRSAWTGFGLFGIVGWSIVVPTLVGAAVGRWLDKTYPETFSWTMSLLIVGLACGCFSAWYWIDKEYKEMHQKPKEKNERNTN